MSFISMVWQQFFPPNPVFSVDNIPDLSGKTALVTGGNTGIGKETIRTLLKKNATVYMASRSKQKAAEAIAELEKDTSKKAIFLQLDLGSLSSIEEAVSEFNGKSSELHMLFNNGGVMNPPVELLTADGYDLQFGTNVLGHFYLTKLLLPILLKTALTSPSGSVRVVNVSSLGHTFEEKLDYKTFMDSPERVKLGTRSLYFQSKFGTVVLSSELARRYGDKGLVSVSLNPGNLRSELHRHAGTMEYIFAYCMCYPVPFGALSLLRAGTSQEGSTLNGKYLIPWARLGEASKKATDPATGTKLWQWLEDQVAGR